MKLIEDKARENATASNAEEHVAACLSAAKHYEEVQMKTHSGEKLSIQAYIQRLRKAEKAQLPPPS